MHVAYVGTQYDFLVLNKAYKAEDVSHAYGIEFDGPRGGCFLYLDKDQFDKCPFEIGDTVENEVIQARVVCEIRHDKYGWEIKCETGVWRRARYFKPVKPLAVGDWVEHVLVGQIRKLTDTEALVVFEDYSGKWVSLKGLTPTTEKRTANQDVVDPRMLPKYLQELKYLCPRKLLSQYLEKYQYSSLSGMRQAIRDMEVALVK